VTGISLGKKEIAHANRVARRTPSIRARFSVSDIKRTGFTDESFDIVWAIESVLYIADKRAVASEFARVLDSNGRAVIADLYLSRKPETDEEKALLDSFALLSSTSALPTYAEMEDALRTNGFSRTSFSDKRDAVLPTSFLYLMNALLTIPIVLPFNKTNVCTFFN
jgi:tocopherol O-methyltransferase